jgi:DNA-binding transcriptional MocR family regulator
VEETGKAMKTAISIPNDLFEEAEAAAKELGLSRSKLMQTALEEFLNRRKAEDVTRRLDKSYAERPAEPDPFLEKLAVEAMKRTEWEE